MIVSSHAQSYRSKADQTEVNRTQTTATQESNRPRVDKDAIRPFRVHVPEKAITDLQSQMAEQTKNFTPEMWTQFLAVQNPMQGVLGSYAEQSRTIPAFKPSGRRA